MRYREQVKDMFEKNNIDIDYSNFIDTEFVIYGLYKALDEFEILNAHLYLTQYYKRFFADESNKENQIFYVLRKNYHQYHNKKQFEMNFERYMDVYSKFRFFDLCDGKIIKNKENHYMTDRNLDYDEMIKSQMKKDNEIKFIENEGFYERVIRSNTKEDNQRLQKFEFNLEDKPSKEIKELPGYTTKKRAHLPLDFDWESFKSKLGSRWEGRPTIQINSLDNPDKNIKYEGIVHIVGLLGAGKSTYIIQETARLLEKNNIKIGIIVPNVTEVIKTYETLSELGIKAAPIIGKTQLLKHRRNFIKVKLSKAESLNEILNEDMKALEYLSGHCKLSYFAGDTDIIESNYPCNKLKKEKDKSFYNCPLFDECGFFKRYFTMEEADVWITTSKSILTSKANQIIDPKKRTYYELFYDSLDIIFIDEADSVQQDFDENFVTSEFFYGGSKSIIEKSNEVESLLKNEKLSTAESEAHRWLSNHISLRELFHRIEYLIQTSKGYEKKLIKDIITPKSILLTLLNSIEDSNSKKSEKFKDRLNSFLPISENLELNDELSNHELYLLYDELKKSPNMGITKIKIEEKINRYIEKYEVKAKPSALYDSQKLLKKRLELYIYIVLLDYFFKIQNITIKNLESGLPEIREIISSFKFYNKDFIHLVTESPVGNIFGYKLKINDKNKLEVELFNYSGIGRSLIEEWPYAKNELGENGPAVVLLSATSYAPKSAHFHIGEEPTFILKSEKEEGKIDQFIKVKYQDYEKILKISGVSDKEIKYKNLSSLTKNLLNDFKIEINHWEKQGTKRKVLIIVNSYEQCRIIGNTLKKEEISYKVLTNNKYPEDDEIISSQIEEIPSLGDIDILVAPLSIISRGYNIIDDSGNSYFGSAFFLIRPYISPEDSAYNYRILNSVISPIARSFSNEGNNISDTITKIRKIAFNMLDGFNEKQFWRNLSEMQREILSWYTFIPLKQAVGRMQRNGSDCRVFYCDGSFLNSKSKGELTPKESMLKSWEEVLANSDSEVGKVLYSNYLAGLRKAIGEYENIITETDWEGEY